jgi:hypothetical protein
MFGQRVNQLIRNSLAIAGARHIIQLHVARVACASPLPSIGHPISTALHSCYDCRDLMRRWHPIE